ncbi:beta-lactamase family protein [Enterovibrio sp. ZSDZ35]|uniref:Beta-lactamase family protein n=1 Tax=Enterovibrio qingdaonensis TaxID=2899818 RepID=A0ABT5QQK6_9GAMM|nr:serine hydrolase [Enterovibrio sp. ZSDZ35]MDD1782879.1 beta-lactamase family protein [Enterovibrio sp. ZSDZ35]
MLDNPFFKNGFIALFISGLIFFVLWFAFYLPEPDLHNFQWTQASKQKDWNTVSPEAEGFDPKTLVELHNHLTIRKTKKVQSIAIIRNGHLVFEQYYRVMSDNDGLPMPRHFPPSADTQNQMRSISKTVVATLIGCLLHESSISDTNLPLYGFFDQSLIPNAEEKANITLEHALNFNSGLDWSEWRTENSDALNMWLSPEPYTYVFNKGVAHQPGDVFTYQGAMSVLLGGVVEAVTGTNLRDYADKALFQPLGISNYDWFAHEQTGEYLGSSGLYLRTRDLAKLGQLYLNKGEWDGERIFSEEWAEESLQPKGRFWKDKSIAYGHNWWFPTLTVRGERIQVAGMRGAGGQELYIFPDYQLVFVMTSGAFLSQDEDYPFELIADYILPAIGLNRVKYEPNV